jgi:hypothetical protein
LGGSQLGEHPLFVPRHDNTLNDAIEALDELFVIDAGSDFDRAWELVESDQSYSSFIDKEVERCTFDRRYYLENYHVIKDEEGNPQTLFPLMDQQEIVLETIESDWHESGHYRRIIVKPRQCGGTIIAGALIFQATIFNERMFTLMMAQNRDTTSELARRIKDAFYNLPWWMRPERESEVQDTHYVFQRADEKKRLSDPGLGSTLIISNAAKEAGIAIGKTIRCAHFSESSRWPDNDSWTSDIEPSMNAKDTQAIMESTGYGRHGIFYNMWLEAVEGGDTDWKPLFIPVYRVRKYFLPVRKNSGFTLTDKEREFRNIIATVGDSIGTYTIPLGFFNWQRRKIKSYIKKARSQEGLYQFQESYPDTWEQAFISSGLCAFSRACLDDQEKLHCRDPIQIGELEYLGPDLAPQLYLHPPKPEELLKKPEFENRFWLWELPDDLDTSTEYYVSADVASGTAKDFSSCDVFRLGFGEESWVQVAHWHGKINPSHFAKVVAALGYWYHTAEVAVEYQAAGVTTGDELKGPLDYPNLYRWKHMDKISGNASLHLHWMTIHRTREDMINRTCEALLDAKIKIRNRHTIAEMRDFGRYEGEGRAEGISNNDDAVMSLMINIAACHQAGKVGANWSEEHIGTRGDRAMMMPQTPMVWGLYDLYGRLVEQRPTEDECKKLLSDLEAKHKIKLPWAVRGIQVSKANTIWSPIWDRTDSPEARLHNEYDVEPKRISPDLVHAFQELNRKGGRGPVEVGEFVTTADDGDDE